MVMPLFSYVRYLKLVSQHSLENKTYSGFLEYFVIPVVLVGFPWTS